MTLVYSVLLFWQRAYSESYELQTSGDGLEGPWTTVAMVMDADDKVDIIDDLNIVTRFVWVL
jgi:hypothetical protein